MKNTGTDSTRTGSSLTFDSRDGPDDHTKTDGSTPSGASSGLELSVPGLGTTVNNHATVVKTSSDVQDPAASDKIAPTRGGSPADSSRANSPPQNVETSLKKRDLLGQLDKTTDQKSIAIGETKPGQHPQLPRELNSDQTQSDPAAYSAVGTSNHGTRDPVPSVGQKRRCEASGGVTDPLNARRRIDSTGNAVVIERRSHEYPQQNQRVEGNGLNHMNAAVDLPQKGRAAVPDSRHGNMGRPSGKSTPPTLIPNHSPETERTSSQTHRPIPPGYGLGSMGVHYQASRAQPPFNHPQMHQYQYNSPFRPPAQYGTSTPNFNPPPSNGRPTLHSYGTPYTVRSPSNPFPTRQEHPFASPSFGMGYLVQDARFSSPYAQRVAGTLPSPASFSNSLGSDATPRRPPPHFIQMDGRAASNQRASFQWGESIPHFPEHKRESSDRQNISSLSNQGNTSALGEISVADSPPPKGAHHRQTSSSSFLSIGNLGLTRGDAEFLQQLHMMPVTHVFEPPMAAVEESKPSPAQSSQGSASPDSMTSVELARGGTSKRVRRKCASADCPNRVVQGGVCISHGAVRKICRRPGCQKKVKKMGLCSAHGPARKRCEANDCIKVAVQGGRCIAHGAKKKLCSVDNCSKQAIMKGMCKRHHDQSYANDNEVHCLPVGAPPPVASCDPSNALGTST